MEKGKRFFLVVVFYVINFGIWELIAPVVSDEWASFLVYAALFIVVLIVCHKEMLEEWKNINTHQLKDKKFYLDLAGWLMADLILTILLLSAIEKMGLDILPKNNESVKTQMASVPIRGDDISFFNNWEAQKQDCDRYFICNFCIPV